MGKKKMADLIRVRVDLINHRTFYNSLNSSPRIRSVTVQQVFPAGPTIVCVVERWFRLDTLSMQALTAPPA
jgi:hypothetical protein